MQTSTSTSIQTVLVTGGLGFIGSHVALLLAEQGYQVIIADNQINSDLGVLDKIRQLLPEAKQDLITYWDVNLRDRQALRELFAQHQVAHPSAPIGAVIHLAALKAVGESVDRPLEYWDNNLISTIYLLKVLAEFKVDKFIFGSSATVYGDAPLPFTESESSPSQASSPYGQTKIAIEYLLDDVARTTNLQVMKLRYFNPIGAHPSGILGEEISQKPLNIFPIISEVYLGLRPEIKVFGDDYPTKDGSCERDYIHIMDLARGHLLAMEYLASHPEVKSEAVNLGSGEPLSVLEILENFNRYSDRNIPYSIGPRRDGDLPVLLANATKAYQLLNFKTEKTLEDMVKDTVRFLQLNYVNNPESIEKIKGKKLPQTYYFAKQ